MRIPDRLRDVLRYPVQTRRRLVLTVLLVAAASWGAWYGVRTLQFRRAHAAAEAALANYDFATAYQQLRECIRLRPNDPELRLLAAQAARRDGQLGEAETRLGEYRRMVKDSTPEGRLEEALQRVTAGQIEGDIEFLLPLADRKPKHPAMEQILEALAVGSVQNYHIDRASFWLTQLLTHFPKNPVGRLLRAQLHGNIGRREQGIQGCRELLADYPDYTKARSYLAGLLFLSQKYEAALAEYEELRSRKPDDTQALLGVARSLDRLDRMDEARPLVRELEERGENDSEALLECARFALKDGRPADAERLLRRALELAPNDHEVHHTLGVALEQLGRSEESQKHIAEFKRIEGDLLRMQTLVEETIKSPRDPAPRRELGTICLRNGQTQEGLRWLHGVLEFAPADRETHQLLANHYASQGNIAAASYHNRLAQ